MRMKGRVNAMFEQLEIGQVQENDRPVFAL